MVEPSGFGPEVDKKQMVSESLSLSSDTLPPIPLLYLPKACQNLKGERGGHGEFTKLSCRLQFGYHG